MKLFSAALVAFFLAKESRAATVSFSTDPPNVRPSDIANLRGTRTENENVSYGDHDAVYMAYDRPIQGQTFRTGTNASSYQIRSITLREVKCDTYCLVPDLKYTIRIIKPSEEKIDVLAMETAEAPASGPGNFQSIGGGGDIGTGSGGYITFTLAKPVPLQPNAVYGFDVNGGSTRHYWQIDGTASNAYAGGSAYSIVNDKIKMRNGDRVFVVRFTTAERAAQNGSSTKLR